MESYSNVYEGIKDYKHDEYLDMLWLPSPKDIFEFNKRYSMHPLEFAKMVPEVEADKDVAELNHFRNLHKYDESILMMTK